MQSTVNTSILTLPPQLEKNESDKLNEFFNEDFEKVLNNARDPRGFYDPQDIMTLENIIKDALSTESSEAIQQNLQYLQNVLTNLKERYDRDSNFSFYDDKPIKEMPTFDPPQLDNNESDKLNELFKEDFETVLNKARDPRGVYDPQDIQKLESVIKAALSTESSVSIKQNLQLLHNVLYNLRKRYNRLAFLFDSDDEDGFQKNINV